MAEVEGRHWWYRGLRDLTERSLRSPRFELPEGPRVLDAGCGTGENLRALHSWLQPSYLGGFDAFEAALELARGKVPATADLYEADMCDLVLRQTDLDLVISFDVISETGAEAALGGLHRLVSALRPGGIIMFHVPAYEWLSGRHDIAVETRDRFTAGSLNGLLERLGLRVELLSYRLCFLFPAVVAARLPGMMRRPVPGNAVRSDLHSMPGGLTNRLLFSILKAENRLIGRGRALPYGSSVFAIGRRA